MASYNSGVCVACCRLQTATLYFPKTCHRVSLSALCVYNYSKRGKEVVAGPPGEVALPRVSRVSGASRCFKLDKLEQQNHIFHTICHTVFLFIYQTIGFLFLTMLFSEALWYIDVEMVCDKKPTQAITGLFIVSLWEIAGWRSAQHLITLSLAAAALT